MIEADMEVHTNCPSNKLGLTALGADLNTSGLVNPILRPDHSLDKQVVKSGSSSIMIVRRPATSLVVFAIGPKLSVNDE